MKAVKVILAIFMAMIFGIAVMLMLPLLLVYAGVKLLTGLADSI